MSTDTFDRNCLCYKDDQNRKWFSAMLLASSARFFQKMYRVQNFEELDYAMSLAGTNHLVEMMDILNAFTKEALIDDVKLTICFENYMKATLLHAGYLIHIIRPAKTHPQCVGLQALAKRQKDEPILITDFLALDAIVYDSQKTMNILPALSDQTIGISKMLDETKYQTVVRLPINIAEVAKGAKNHRNNIHYLLGEAASYSSQQIDNMIECSDFINLKIIDPFNSWCIQSALPKKKINHTQLRNGKNKRR